VPVYETYPGWDADLGACRSIDELPTEALDYLDAIERQAGVPISIVSLGPERMQTIARHAGNLALAMAAGAR
jgi:adenylosuccinate synthase